MYTFYDHFCIQMPVCCESDFNWFHLTNENYIFIEKANDEKCYHGVAAVTMEIPLAEDDDPKQEVPNSSKEDLSKDVDLSEVDKPAEQVILAL